MAPKRKSAAPNRSFKVSDQIQRDLSELIARELKDPRVGMVTLQGVEVTPDYAHAKVFFSLLMGDPDADRKRRLNQAAGFLRNGLFKRLHIHTVPTLHFVYDRTTERAADMNALIAKAVSSRGRRGSSKHDAPPAHGCSGALCTGWCCSTNRWAFPATTPCKRSSGCCAPKRRAIPVRWIPWPPACCRCALVRPPSSASCSWTPPRPTIAIARLGQTTTTGRCRRRRAARAPGGSAADRPEVLAQVQQRFTGPIRQVPPMYSALKKRWQGRCTSMRRAGIEVERPATRRDHSCTRHRFVQGCGRLRCVATDGTCSKGTTSERWQRTWGEALGCGAHLRSLRRNRYGRHWCGSLRQL